MISVAIDATVRIGQTNQFLLELSGLLVSFILKIIEIKIISIHLIPTLPFIFPRFYLIQMFLLLQTIKDQRIRFTLGCLLIFPKCWKDYKKD